MQKFYLVWNEQGSSPTFKHLSFPSAEQEATPDHFLIAAYDSEDGPFLWWAKRRN